MPWMLSVGGDGAVGECLPWSERPLGEVSLASCATGIAGAYHPHTTRIKPAYHPHKTRTYTCQYHIILIFKIAATLVCRIEVWVIHRKHIIRKRLDRQAVGRMKRCAHELRFFPRL